MPTNLIKDFAKKVNRLIVVEELDGFIEAFCNSIGLFPEGKALFSNIGEFSQKTIAAAFETPNTATVEIKSNLPPRPPVMCAGCPHRGSFYVFKKMKLIVTGDIGCYTLGALPPWEAMDIQLCMGAGIGIGVGLRHTLPEDQAKRVVSVIGDSTFMHSGLTGLAEMIYNPPPTGHVLVILDNGTTAMTGQQEHPGTGRTLTHEPTGRVMMEEVARAMGANVDVLDAFKEPEKFEELLRRRLSEPKISVIISRRPCILAAGKIREYERAALKG